MACGYPSELCRRHHCHRRKFYWTLSVSGGASQCLLRQPHASPCPHCPGVVSNQECIVYVNDAVKFWKNKTFLALLFYVPAFPLSSGRLLFCPFQEEVPGIKDDITHSWQMAKMCRTGPLAPSPWIPSALLVSPPPAVLPTQGLPVHRWGHSYSEISSLSVSNLIQIFQSCKYESNLFMKWSCFSIEIIYVSCFYF